MIDRLKAGAEHFNSFCESTLTLSNTMADLMRAREDLNNGTRDMLATRIECVWELCHEIRMELIWLGRDFQRAEKEKAG